MRFTRMTWMAAVLGTAGLTGMVGCSKGFDPMAGKGAASIQASVKAALTAGDVKSVCVTISGGVPTALAAPITVPLTGSGLQYSAVVSDLPISSYTVNGGAYASTDCTGTALYAPASAGTVAITKGATATVVLNMNQVDAPVSIYNEAPIIDTLTASTLVIPTNDTVSITVTGHDPDAGQTAGIKWGWTSSCGSVAPATGLGATSTVTFTAPATDATCQVNITATDAVDPSLVNNASLSITVGAASATGNAKVVANLNTCPVMTKLTAFNLPLKVNYVAPDMLTLSALATDADGDALVYTWSLIPNATGTPNAGSTCVGSFGDVHAKDTIFTLTSTNMAECTFGLSVTDGTFADNTSKCTIANHLSIPVKTDGMDVAGAPILGFDYQSSPTIASGQTVGFAIEVRGGCKGGAITTAWSSTIGTPAVVTPASLGLSTPPFTNAATILGISSDPPAPVVTFTATCASDTTIFSTHVFTPSALTDVCTGQPLNSDCTEAARLTNKCVLAATCQPAGCVPTAGQVKTCANTNTPCQTDVCVPSTGDCGLSAMGDGPSPSCTDSTLCTSDLCVAGACTHSPTATALSCADPNECTKQECAPSTGLCANSGYSSSKTCNDGLFCTINDHCDGAGACVSGGDYACGVGLVCDNGANACIAPICDKAQWDKDLGQTAYANAAGPDGNMWAAGAMFGAYDFGNGATRTACSSDAFVAKYAADGSTLQAWNFGDPNVPCKDQNAKGVAVASNGNVVVVGQFNVEIDFTAAGSGAGVPGTDYLQSTGSQQYYVVMDASSAGASPTVLTGAAHMITVGTGALTSAGSNPTKNVVAICGNATGAVPLWAANNANNKGLTYPTAGVSGGGTDIIVALLDATNGNVIWGKQIGGTGDQTCTSVTVDYNGDVVLTGTYGGTLTFGSNTLPTTTGSSLYVAKLKGSDGSALASAAFGTQGTMKGAIAVDANNNVAIAGQMSGIVAVGTSFSFASGISVPYAGGLDAFLLKLDSSLVPTCAFADGNSYDQVANGVGFDSAGAMHVGGGFVNAMPALSLSQTSITNFDAFEVSFNASCVPGCIKTYGDVAGTQQISTLSVANGASVPAAVRNSVYVGGAYSSQMSFDTSPASTLDTGAAGTIRNFLARLKP
jgi:hypothetical protein